MMMRPGTWWIRSESDPRWPAIGRGEVGMLVRPPEVDVKIAELTKLYGDPPVDLESGYEKD
jgi:hypothetical protein